MNTSGIYKIQSKIKPEKIYVGSSINIAKRWNKHLSELMLNRHPNKKLQNHFNKYGREDFEFSILATCNKNELINIEQFFIDSYKPYFNIRLKAESNIGLKQSALTIEKRVKKLIGQKRSEEVRSKMGKCHIGNKYNLGRIVSLKTKDKIRNSLIGRKRPEIKINLEWRINIGKSLKGKRKPKRTKEHIENWRRSRMKEYN